MVSAVYFRVVRPINSEMNVSYIGLEETEDRSNVKRNLNFY